MKKLILLAVFFLTPLSAVAAPALVQANHNPMNAGSSTTVAQAFSSNITAGNLIVVRVSWGYLTDGAKPSSVTDNEGNTYTEITNTYTANTDNFQYTNLYYKENAACSGGCGAATVTATWVATRPYRSITIVEFSGVATSGALDQSTGQYQVGTSAPTSGSVTTTTNGQLIVGSTEDTSTGSVTITLANTIISNTGATDGAAMQYQVQGTAGSVSSSFTFSGSRNANTSIATFKDNSPPKIKRRVIAD